MSEEKVNAIFPVILVILLHLMFCSFEIIKSKNGNLLCQKGKGNAMNFLKMDFTHQIFEHFVFKNSIGFKISRKVAKKWLKIIIFNLETLRSTAFFSDKPLLKCPRELWASHIIYISECRRVIVDNANAFYFAIFGWISSFLPIFGGFYAFSRKFM